MSEMWGTGPHPNRHQGDESVPTAARLQHCNPHDREWEQTATKTVPVLSKSSCDNYA